jgi:hypothetical protein
MKLTDIENIAVEPHEEVATNVFESAEAPPDASIIAMPSLEDAPHDQVAVAIEHDEDVVPTEDGDDAAVSVQAPDTTTPETTVIAAQESPGKFASPLSYFFFFTFSPPRLASLDAPTRASIAQCTCPHRAGWTRQTCVDLIVPHWSPRPLHVCASTRYPADLIVT